MQSTAANIVRVPLDRPNGKVEVTHVLPPHTVPDGLAFCEDGRSADRLLSPDVVYLGHPGGHVELFLEDLTGELLNRPTNIAIGQGELYIANLGGWHISKAQTRSAAGRDPSSLIR